MQPPDASPSGIKSPFPTSSPPRPVRAVLAALILPLLAAAQSPQGINSVTLPEGTIERRRVTFEAPDPACESYLQEFSERVWLLNVPTPAAFATMLERLPLSPEHRAALLNPAWWRTNTSLGGFEVRPDAAFLRGLSLPERTALYGLLARWLPNKPERWPIVFPDRAALTRLRTLGHAPALIDLVEACAYPFAGGLAFSDFSLLAAEFPDHDALVRFLQDSSAVSGFVPRLKLRTVLSVSNALTYWTVDNHNPFARPILEALIESETDTGTELTTLMPGVSRVLSNNIEPDEVRHDASLTSFMISSSLSGMPQFITRPDEFQRWLAREYVRVEAPYRYGDLMILERSGGLPVRYACAYVTDNFVFAKDPVGLGLWRFMYLGEVLNRNPHFAGGSWTAYRRRSPGMKPTAVASPLSAPVTGPWGTLRAARVNLAPPDHWLDVSNLFRPQDWAFTGVTWTEIEALLRRSQLAPIQLTTLLDPALRTTEADGTLVLRAPPALRLGLTTTSRELIYNYLGLHGSNPSHHVPLVLPEAEAEYERANLNPALRELLGKLAYGRKGLLCLSDTDLLQDRVTDEAEARRLKRFLFNTPALQVELTRASLADPAAVTAYWRKNDGRNTASLLRWFERSPDLESVDVSNLLPPIPQQLLNTFPEATAGGRTNCFWTSLNFFARQPDNRFMAGIPGQADQQTLIVDELQQNYRRVQPPFQFGDVLCLVDPRPVGFGILHMMNYVAGDIAFTKNGFSALAPSVFMRLADVDRLYPTMFDLQLQGYRRKAPDQP